MTLQLMKDYLLEIGHYNVKVYGSGNLSRQNRKENTVLFLSACALRWSEGAISPHASSLFDLAHCGF